MNVLYFKTYAYPLLLALLAAYASGRSKGKTVERNKRAKARVEAIQEKREIDRDVQDQSDADLIDRLSR